MYVVELLFQMSWGCDEKSHTERVSTSSYGPDVPENQPSQQCKLAISSSVLQATPLIMGSLVQKII